MAWTKTATKSGTYEFQTAGKFVDRDIDLVIPKASVTGSGSASVSDFVSTINKSYSTGQYASYASKVYKWNIDGTATANIGGTVTPSISTAGFTDSDSLVAGSVSGSLSESLSGTFSLPEGGTALTVGNTVKPSSLSVGTDNVSTETITSTQPSSGYYVHAIPKTIDTTISKTKTTITEGYITPDNSSATASGTTSGGTADFYIGITAGNIGVSDYHDTTTSGTDLTGYTENTDAIVSSGGSLKIPEGYYPNTFITLKTLIPDSANIGDTKGDGTILTGTTAYDKDGNLVSGTMANNGDTSGTITTQNGTITIPAGYTSGGTVKATLTLAEAQKITGTAATPTLSITDSTSTITPTAISGNTSFYNITTSVTGKTSYGTAGYISTSGLSAVADTSATVGRIVASTSNVADGGTIAAGSQLTVTAGYYPNDRTFTAQDAGSAILKTDITGTLATSITDGYTAPTLSDSAGTGPVLEISGNGTATTGYIYTGSSTAKTQYMTVYDGSYTIS